MQNEEIIKIIDNLKGRRKYEEKKAAKLGFSSLYAYFENKVFQQKKAIIDKEKELGLIKKENNSVKKENKKKTCGCC